MRVNAIWQASVRTKIALIPIAIGLAVGATGLYAAAALANQKASSRILTLVSRQRMLSERHVKNLLLGMRGIETDDDRVRDVLGQTIDALLEGRPAPAGLGGGTTPVASPAPPDVRPLLLEQRELLAALDRSAARLRSDDPGTALTEVLALADRFQRSCDATLIRYIGHLSASISRSITVGAIGCGSGLLLALAFSWALGRAIVRPLEAASSAARAVAARDFSVSVETESDDEIGTLAHALNTMVDELASGGVRLRGTAASLSRASGVMDDTSRVMTEAAAATAQRASTVTTAAGEVSGTLQTIATAVEEMSLSIKEIAASAAEAARVASSAMTSMGETEQAVGRLSESGDQIRSLVSLIATIARQTNLLALNATIEASRAGESGRGFAVVAGEVKELALQASRASEEIDRRVGAIGANTASVTQAAGHIGAIIQRISELQAAIAVAVEQQSATMNGVAGHIAHAASSSDSIAREIGGVAGSAGSTEQTAESARATARELSELAASLDAYASALKLDTRRVHGPGDREARRLGQPLPA